VPKSRIIERRRFCPRRAKLKSATLVSRSYRLPASDFHHGLSAGDFMFTFLAFGLCALVIETPEDRVGARFAVDDYPAVGIGIVDRSQCRLTLVLAAGKQTLGVPINGQFHRFKVEKIDQASGLTMSNPTSSPGEMRFSLARQSRGRPWTNCRRVRQVPQVAARLKRF
jgi:hypothetical protein